MDEIPEEERLEFVRSYGVEPVTDINTDLTLDEAATFVAEMTPIVGDAMAAKEIYDELMEEEPNYPLIAALGGTAIVGSIPGIGDAAAAGLKKIAETYKRLEVDPDAVGMLGGNIRIKPKVEEGTPTVEAAGLTDEAIEEWRKENATKEDFRKSLKGRNEELQEAAAGVEEGRVFTSTYRKLADDLRPIRKVTEVPKPATFVEAVSALNAGKRKKPMIGLNASIPEGDVVTARLDIDAYTDYDVWVPTLTHPELKTVYKPSVILEDVTFIKPEGREPKKALGVAKGGAKAPFAVMSGKYVNATDDDAYNIAKEAFDNPEFTQVGYDPTRRGFFYDRETGEAVVEADTVVQVGHLVLARNAKKMDAEAFSFSEGGMALEEQMEMNFGSKEIPENTIGIDPVSGNEIPLGSSPENVRDDIPANLSVGEIVVPADVVNFHGVKLFEDLRAEAKLGYAQMAEDGRMGGEPMEEDPSMMFGDLDDIDIDLSEEDLESTFSEAEEAFLGKFFKSLKNPQPSAKEKFAKIQANAKKRDSVGRVTSASASGKPKFKNRAEELLYNLRGGSKSNKKSYTKPAKPKSKAKFDFGFGGNPMERAARKYGGEDSNKKAGKVKQAYTGKPKKEKGVNLRSDESFRTKFMRGLGVEGYNEGGMADMTPEQDDTFARKGGFDMEAAMDYGLGTAPLLEMREYMNSVGHRIFITFINGEPQMAIPEGYFPVGDLEKMTDEVQETTQRKKKDKDPIEPNDFSYTELTIDELQEEVSNVVKPSLTIIDKIGKKIHTSQLIKEIDRRLAMEDVPIYEQEYLKNLKLVAENPEPSFLTQGLAKLTGQEIDRPDLPNLTGPENPELTGYSFVEPYSPEQDIDDGVKSPTPYTADDAGGVPLTPEQIEKAKQISKEAAEIAFSKKKAAKEEKPAAFTASSISKDEQRRKDRQQTSKNLQGKSTKRKTGLAQSATRGLSDDEKQGGAALDTRFGISGLNKGGLASKKGKKKKSK